MPDTANPAPTRAAVMEVVRRSSEPLQPKEIAKRTDKPKDSVQKALGKLKEAGRLAQPGYGLYDLPERVEPGQDESRESTSADMPTANNDERTGRFVRIPLYSIQANAGKGGPLFKEEIQEYVSYNREQLRRDVGADPDELAIITVKGNSMEPTLRPGDRIWIVLHNGGPLKDGSIYVLRNPASGIIVKRLYWETETKARLVGDNDQVPDNEIHPDDSGETSGWEVLGQVVQVQKHL